MQLKCVKKERFGYRLDYVQDVESISFLGMKRIVGNVHALRRPIRKSGKRTIQRDSGDILTTTIGQYINREKKMAYVYGAENGNHSLMKHAVGYAKKK